MRCSSRLHMLLVVLLNIRICRLGWTLLIKIEGEEKARRKAGRKGWREREIYEGEVAGEG